MDKHKKEDREFVNKLVANLLEHPCIYATDRTDFKDIYKKEESWVAIAEELGTTPSVAQKRYKSLRDVYTRLKRTHCKSRKSSKQKHYMKWPYFEQMSFLDPYLKPGSKPKRPPMTTCKHEAEEDQQVNRQNNSDEHSMLVTGSESKETETEITQHDSIKKTRRSTTKDTNEFESSLINILDVVLKRREEPTESSLWAQSIAMRLERMTPYQRALARVKIENMLLEMEFD